MSCFLKLSLKIKNLSVQLYLFPVVSFTAGALCFYFCFPGGKAQPDIEGLASPPAGLQIRNGRE